MIASTPTTSNPTDILSPPTTSNPIDILSPRSKAILKRSSIANLTSNSFFCGSETTEVTLTPLGATIPAHIKQKTTRDAKFWRDVIKETQKKTKYQSNNKNNSKKEPGTNDIYYRRNGAGARNPIGGALAERDALLLEREQKKGNKDAMLLQMNVCHSSVKRAAGLLVSKDDDDFERQLAIDLENVKGIDLDGDGQIDDDELEFAKEMEARLIRSKAFCKKVESMKCPWKWFGKKWQEMHQEQRIDYLFKNPHFDINLDTMNTKLRNFSLTQSPRMQNHLSPHRKMTKMLTTAERRKEHEERIYKATQNDLDMRVLAATEDPLSTQPQSYRDYLTALNPITQRYTFE